MVSPSQITGLVLAGGRGSRMGGIDKGLQPFQGTPLAQHAARRLGRQVASVAINANRNLAGYAAFGLPVWTDGQADHPGPLAGFLAGLTHCETPWLLTVPCDTPMFPLDLAARLAAALVEADAEIAVAGAPEMQENGSTVPRTQPVFCLMSVALRQSLERFVHDGGRKVSAWTARHAAVHVPFDRAGDAPDAFLNANTLAELQALEAGASR
ncbi:MAG: molybdenum cofactor guanylyltransferase MobA [Variovorax sp.]